jgi:hypothetical protein
MHGLELLRSAAAKSRRRGALSLFRLAGAVLHAATGLYERHMIPVAAIRAALSLAGRLERWAAALHPCLGRGHFRNRRKDATCGH